MRVFEMRRRVLALGAIALAMPRMALSQGTAKRVGVIGVAGGGTYEMWKKVLPKEFAALGWVDGRNLQLIWYDVVPVTANAGNSELRSLGRKRAAQMAADHLDCMIVNGDPQARMLQEATRTIPIVAVVGDPVAAGFAKTLARPGANMTGLHGGAEEIALKTVELFRRLAPGSSCVAWIGPENFKTHGAYIEAAAKSFKLRYREIVYDSNDAAEVVRVQDGMAGLRRDGCLMAEAMPFGPEFMNAMAESAIRHRLVLGGPPGREGFLLAYGEQGDNALPTKRVVALVSRILHGERPADMPFEGPTRYSLTLNLKTAARIGVTVPKDVLVLADRVIHVDTPAK